MGLQRASFLEHVRSEVGQPAPEPMQAGGKCRRGALLPRLLSPSLAPLPAGECSGCAPQGACSSPRSWHEHPPSRTGARVASPGDGLAAEVEEGAAVLEGEPVNEA